MLGAPKPPASSSEPPGWLQGQPKISLFVPQKDLPVGNWSSEAQASLLGKLTHLSALGGRDCTHGPKKPQDRRRKPELRCERHSVSSVCPEVLGTPRPGGGQTTSSPLAITADTQPPVCRSPVWEGWDSTASLVAQACHPAG